MSAGKRTRRQRHSYSPEVADLICERIAVDGLALRQICQHKTMPARSTLFVWLRRHPEFAREYKFAKWLQIQWMADEMVDIANGRAGDCNPENFRLAKRRIVALQSRLSKLKPKRYRWE
jgi:hypothetical protein